MLLSIVIPAYNEQERLPIMLDAATSYVNTHRSTLIKSCQAATTNASKATSIEWIIVSDGSTDDTCTVVERVLATVSPSFPVVFGSRAHLSTSVKRSLVRTFLMHAFHFFVTLLCTSRVKDFRLASSEVLSAHSSCMPFTFSSHCYAHHE